MGKLIKEIHLRACRCGPMDRTFREKAQGAVLPVPDQNRRARPLLAASQGACAGILPLPFLRRSSLQHGTLLCNSLQIILIASEQQVHGIQ